MFDTLRLDLRFAGRSLRRNPGFALVVVLTLALGIGANSAIFSVVETVLLDPVPFPASDHLVGVWSTGRGGDMRFGLSYPDYQDVKAMGRDFAGVAAFTQQRYNLTGRAEPREVEAGLVDPGLFAVLGVRPAAGRGFSDAELRDPVAVLSHGLAADMFGTDAAALGQSVQLDGRALSVVGVMPGSFAFPDDGVQLWIPLGAAFLAQPDAATDRDFHAFNTIARMRDDVDLGTVRSDLGVLASRLSAAAAQQQPSGRREIRVEQNGGGARAGGGPAARAGGGPADLADTGFLVHRLRDEVAGDVRTPLLVLLGVVALVLLIACANAANLYLARASSRQREIAVRRALGAGRARLVAQLLTESVVLSLAAGAVGLGLATWGVSALLAAWPGLLPRADAIGLDGGVVAFTVLVSVLTGVAFGLAPALRSSRAPVESALREGASATPGPRRHRLQRGLVAAEIALALVVLTGAGLLVRSFVRLSAVAPGYDTKGVLAARVRLTPSRYPEMAQQLDFYGRALEALRRQPGVASASLSRTLPLSGEMQMLAIDPRTVRPDDPESFLPMGMGMVGDDYFRTLGIPVTEGRAFTEQDRQGSQPVAIVNRRLAERLWPGESPIGRTIPIDAPGGASTDVTVVGVAGDVRFSSLADAVPPQIYLPLAQSDRPAGRGGVWLVARTSGDAASLAGAVRAAVRGIDPEQPVAVVTTLGDMMRRSTADRRFNLTLVTLFALLALGLAVVGVYGVTAFTTAQRTREIGVRMALGALRGDVLRMLLRETAVVAAIGLVAGLAGAFAATRVLSTLLYGVRATDPITFAAAAAALGLAAVAAALPAVRRAAATDPVRALRHE